MTACSVGAEDQALRDGKVMEEWRNGRVHGWH
jgi:hypothetical protein